MQTNEGHDNDLEMICNLPPGSFNTDSIVSNLRERFYVSQTFLPLSHTILLSLNPYSPNGAHENEEVLRYCLLVLIQIKIKLFKAM